MHLRRAAIAAVLAAVGAAAGCGEGSGGDRESYAAAFERARPCLKRLALLGSHDPHILTLPTQQVTTISSESAGVTVPEWVADLAYLGREARDGAGSAFLRFYKNEEDATHAAGGGAEVVAKTVVVWWSATPTRRQERQLEACLEVR